MRSVLAIINPFEVLPVYLKLLEGKDVKTHRQVAWKACVYALLLSLFFLIFGTLILRLIFDGVIEALESHGVTTLHRVRQPQNVRL